MNDGHLEVEADHLVLKHFQSHYQLGLYFYFFVMNSKLQYFNQEYVADPYDFSHLIFITLHCIARD